MWVCANGEKPNEDAYLSTQKLSLAEAILLKKKKEAKLQAERQRLFDKDVARKNAAAKKKAESDPTIVQKKEPTVKGLRFSRKVNTPSFVIKALRKLARQAGIEARRMKRI